MITQARIKTLLTLATLAMAAIAMTATSANAGLVGQLGILDVTGTNPATGEVWTVGDQYRLVFVSSVNTTCESTDITTYNAFVQGLADAAGLGGATWNMVGSTATVDARDNTNTHAGEEFDGVGEPVLRMDGTFIIANDYADLWNGINVSHVDGENWLGVHLDENGTERLHERVRTGSDASGTASTDQGRVLGGSEEATPKVQTGRNFAPPHYSNLGGNNWMRDWSEAATAAGPVYAMSEPLTVALAGLLGDADGNGVVDSADYIMVKTHFGGAPAAGTLGSGGDFNLNGTVEWDDLQIVIEGLNASGESPSVPEPTTLFLTLAAGLPALLKRRRSRS